MLIRVNWSDVQIIRSVFLLIDLLFISILNREKRDSENKRERRRQAREYAVRHLEKKLLENGYESLEKFSVDRAMQTSG